MEQEGGTKENMEDNDNNNLEIEEPSTGLVEMNIDNLDAGVQETTTGYDLGLDF